MKIEALRESHLRQLFDRLQSDADNLGSEYMSFILGEWEWFHDDFLDGIQDPFTVMYYVVVDGTDVIGLIQLSSYSDHVRAGYWLYEPYRGRGIMTTALTELLSTVTRRVVVTVELHNDKSSRLMERIGFNHAKTDETYLYYESDQDLPIGV